MKKDMDELDRKIAKARGIDPDAEDKASEASEKMKATSMAMRMAIELCTGILVGTALGYGLDELFGTKPLLLIVFMMFGAAAGFLNLYRSSFKDE